MGEVPSFVLTVQNNSKDQVRIVDAGQKHLQSVWYQLNVRQDGKSLDLPAGLPGRPFMDDRSYVTVKPGEKVEFELTKFALRVNELPPGRYKASIGFRVDSAKDKSTHYDSPFAEFTVEK